MYDRNMYNTSAELSHTVFSIQAIFGSMFWLGLASLGELPASSDQGLENKASNIVNDLKTLHTDVNEKQDENVSDDDLSKKVIRTLDNVLGVYGVLLQTLINLVLVNICLF